MDKKLFDKMYNLASKIAIKNNDLIKKTGFSSVGCAIMGESGKIYTGISVGWYHSSCAEVVALGNALQNGERKIKYVTAVKYNKRNNQVESLTPCGVCREMFNQLHPEVKIVYLENNQIIEKSINEMLPNNQ